MSNKHLVLTICTGDKYQAMGQLTHPTFEAYAKKIGADFLVINKTDKSSPHWEKFQIYDLLVKYDRILFVDSDIIIRSDSPNLFDIVPKDSFGVFDEAPFTPDRKYSLIKACEEYDIKLPNWKGQYYNTGVMVISRIHREIFKHPGKEIFNFYEQGYLNAIIQKLDTKCFILPYKYNRMTCLDVVTGEERFASYFIHYAGVPNVDFVLQLIKKDLDKWTSDAPQYKYKRHILVDVQGGLGDQVDAEPAIRYMKKYIYPDDDIVIKTHFPRLFEHLGLPVTTHEEFVRQDDTPYYHVITLPGTESLQWAIVSNLLCHTVDYVAMALLKRTLPEKDKKIQLMIKPEDKKEVTDLLKAIEIKDLVLVHAGKHWQSKTFPKQWWQDVIDGLHKEGKKVCLIGKDEDTRGVWDLQLKPGMYDTRNLLSLGGLIALISEANMVISNDSAPVHLAGAFDNNIILIPTCKHPDHILPFRGNSRTYKQKALYKKLSLDDCGQAPTELYETSAEFIKREFKDYLPLPTEVVAETIKMIGKNISHDCIN